MKPEPRAFARVVSITFRPDTLELAAERFRDTSAPLVRRQTGSLGIIGGANPTTGNTWAISFWSTRADLERSNADPQVTAALSGYAQWMAGPFSVQSFDVIDMSFPDADPDPAAQGGFGRVTTLAPQPGFEPEVTAALQDYLAQARERSGGRMGTLLLVPHIGHQLLAFELWPSQAAAPSDSARIEDHRIRHPSTVERPPAREMIEMFGRY